MEYDDGEALRLDSILELLQHVCCPPSFLPALGEQAGQHVGDSLRIFRSAVLRVVTHLSSGIAGSHVALSLTRVASTKNAMNLDKSMQRPGTNLCLASLLMFLSYQANVAKEKCLGEKSFKNNTDSSVELDFFSYGLCLETIKNIMLLEAVPYEEIIPLVDCVVSTLQHCDDMRVICAAASVLSTVLMVLGTTSNNCEIYDDDFESSAKRPLYSYSSDERMHIVNYICTHTAQDYDIMQSIKRIFEFFLFKKSLASRLSSSGEDNVEDESLMPSASTCDSSMWLVGNEFGMRTTGTFSLFLFRLIF